MPPKTGGGYGYDAPMPSQYAPPMMGGNQPYYPPPAYPPQGQMPHNGNYPPPMMGR